MTLEIFKKSLMEASVVKKGDYSYIVHPITDDIPEIKSDPKFMLDKINRLNDTENYFNL